MHLDITEKRFQVDVYKRTNDPRMQEVFDLVMNKKAFFEAIKLKKREKILQFINKGINVNTKDDSGWSALMFATDSDDYKTARLLLEKGADIDIQDEDRQTPLMNCALHMNCCFAA